MAAASSTPLGVVSLTDSTLTGNFRRGGGVSATEVRPRTPSS